MSQRTGAILGTNAATSHGQGCSWGASPPPLERFAGGAQPKKSDPHKTCSGTEHRQHTVHCCMPIVHPGIRSTLAELTAPPRRPDTATLGEWRRLRQQRQQQRLMSARLGGKVRGWRVEQEV